MDQQPQSSRSSFSEPNLLVQGPIPLFDTHLKVVTDSYLSFFQERRRIEETYIESMRKLFRKTRSVDMFLDEKGDRSTLRIGWSEVVDNLDREAQARQAWLLTLTTDVIIPLTNLKETQERTRKRIKEDLRDSTIAYDEYAEVVLPKLKSRYVKKYAEVEDQKRSTNTSPPLPVPSANPDNDGLAPNAPRPQVASPQPLRALDRRPSGTYGGRNRSPTSSTAFSDLAHQGKKQLNQLIGFLDKGGVKDGLSGRENQALKTVRAKRDLDEADRDYRKGVHWLETLRLRRTKTLENGYKSLEMFVEESAESMKKVLLGYTDNMVATSSTLTQLSTHLRSVVDRIKPQRDVDKLKTHIPRSLASAIPDPILYEHGQVGECNDLIFGFSLVDYATAKGLPEGAVPKIIRICIEEIDKRGLDSEGIYRVSGRHAVVQSLQREIEKDEGSFEFSPKDDTYAVASLLKLYLREIPEPVFRFPLQDRIQHTEDREEHISNKFMLLRSKIRRLPPVHQAALKALMEHLARVAARCQKNKMDPKNLAIVFGGVIFGDDEMPKGGDLLSVQTAKDTLMEDLIIYAHILYSPAASHSPPLPPTPLEPVPPVTYGSKMTKVATVPPTAPSQDFAPSLPPRPNNSIHPSSRASYSPNKSKSYPEKGLLFTIPDQTLSEIPSPPSPASTLSEERNSVLFPIQSEPPEGGQVPQKVTDEPSSTPRS